MNQNDLLEIGIIFLITLLHFCSLKPIPKNLTGGKQNLLTNKILSNGN